MNSDLVRILIIDDEIAIRQLLKMSLGSSQYQIFEANDGQSGLNKISEFHPHVVLLDLGLPDIHGFQVLKDLRKWSRVPVIVLTVADDEQTKVALLDAGADDYLTKPFSTKELIARIRVAVRNVGLIEATPIFNSNDLQVNLISKKVFVDNIEIKLSQTEYELLALLVRDHGRIIPQATLLKKIWGSQNQDQSHYLRIYINQLRKKIEKVPSQPLHIITEPGVGYKIE